MHNGDTKNHFSFKSKKFFLVDLPFFINLKPLIWFFTKLLYMLYFLRNLFCFKSIIAFKAFCNTYIPEDIKCIEIKYIPKKS